MFHLLDFKLLNFDLFQISCLKTKKKSLKTKNLLISKL